MTDSVIDRTVGFRLGGVEDTETAFTVPLGEAAYSYARRENPTVTDCERALAEVESCQWCVLTPCGMAAIDTALSVFNDANDRRPWVFPAGVYSGTAQYAAEVLKGQRGVDVCFAYPAGTTSTTACVIDAIEGESPALVYIEPITNPMLDVVDVPAVVQAARRQGARVVVDNTVATSYLFKPLAAGADLVVHSATKWLAGHNDILAGVIGVDDPDLRARLLVQRSTIGSVISPDDAGRLKSELATFSLRVARQNATAAELAEHLAKHPDVARVRYPGLASDAGHTAARRLFEGRGSGALITFDLARDEDGCSRFVDDLGPHIPHIPSMGEVTTSFLHIKACFGAGYEPSTIRLSVGVEPFDTIVERLEQALRTDRRC